MGQVVKFFGYLILAVGTALIVFGHISIVLVHGWGYLVKQISSSPQATALWAVALVPGALVYGLGVLIERLGQRAEVKCEAGQSADELSPPPDQAES
ncbi:MAG: hypothetical protein OQK24_06780 [Magnetovibrio sp.]|nr:hypothetical protein [Magnetovibrio sp.]